MSEVFSPGTIGNLVLPNRFVRAATWEGMADAEGAPTERLIAAMNG
jgi:2,4-dienoyl-CoA reductase-like NADH-dependent reductase (Old Yellow Enzyme family)